MASTERSAGISSFVVMTTSHWEYDADHSASQNPPLHDYRCSYRRRNAAGVVPFHRLNA